TLSAAHPALDIYCGTTTEGAYRTGDLHIHHAGRGNTLIGQQGRQEPPGWFSDYSHAIEPCIWEPDIDSALWHKLAVNCVINPLTAVHRCDNGALAEGELREQVEQLCAEVAQVSYAAGYTRTAQNILQDALNVIAATATNRSSMRQDVEAGRPTEIDFITGYLLQRAQEHGIAAPLNNALMHKVRGLGSWRR
ncbi:MAG: 2-dehydropantoate 2-reductase, partial [Halioglobus sp.]|nr:2-dehydropantoate 2-reductase [Halioglobus sp.]